eukprot:CAMPEP_0174271638 /NCGR_PEP_ID=MMETSP0439-20130205/48546_1 /TAXON_ID=0 /ORGANISM="Stereomyxa ramosa, Strain Chinc5" /LENGTH=144 /DNA_ID=CAMNT_0015361763 /DNA_START=38 /DNA_END=469 /DNA_ORIENTATION=+
MQESDSEYSEKMREMIEFNEMSKSGLSTSVVCKRLKLNEKDVVAVYLLGSRLWGTASWESDWDFIVVHNKWKDKSTTHSGNIDACVISKTAFIQRVQEDHHFLETMCMFLPTEYKWKEDLKIPDFEIRPNKLYDAVVAESERDW